MADSDTAPVPDDDGPPPTLSTWTEPEVSLRWSEANLSAPFLAAIARAQATLETVGKRARAEAGDGAPAYDYATNDSIVGEFRRRFAAVGISLVSSWRVFERPWAKISDKQWLDFTVVVDFALLYGDAEGNTGFLPGSASSVAIGSRGRPPDKSLYAARTSIMGAVALGLGSMDRAKVSKDEDINQREGDGDASGGRRGSAPRGRVSPETEVRDRIAKQLAAVKSIRQAAGMAPWTNTEIIESVMGVEGYDATTLEDAEALSTALAQLILDADPRRRKPVGGDRR